MLAFRPLQRYFDFKGRSGRAEFWQWVLASTAAGLVAHAIDAITNNPYTPGRAPVTAALLFGTFIPQLSVSWRRLHDRNRSGWFYGIALILLAVSMVAMLGGGVFNQQSGDDTLLGVGVVLFGLWILYAIFLIVQFAKRGDPGPNAYGSPDTYAASSLPDDLTSTARKSIIPGGQGDLNDQLGAIERLGRMRDSGLLSQDEFEAQKRRILADQQPTGSV